MNDQELTISEQLSGISHKTLLNIFQIENGDMYNKFEAPDLSDDLHGMLHTLLAMAGSPVTHHFANPSMTQDIKLHIRSEEKGSFVMYLDYSLNATAHEETGSKSRSLLVIGKIKPDHRLHEDNRIEPHFVLAGYTAPIDVKTDAVFIPQDVACRQNLNNEGSDSMATLSEDFGLMAAICYADEAIKTIMLEQPVNMWKNQEWLTEERDAEIPLRFAALKTRTAQSFKKELIEGTTKPEEIFISNPSSTSITMEGPRGVQ